MMIKIISQGLLKTWKILLRWNFFRQSKNYLIITGGGGVGKENWRHAAACTHGHSYRCFMTSFLKVQ